MATIRTAEANDYDLIVSVMDEWWGRPIALKLPRLFLDHFCQSSFVAWTDGAIVGFLVGFLSPARPEESYIHFAGVHPEERGRGLARELYEKFFELARSAHATRVRAITSPRNTGSVAFHSRMGFEVSDTITSYDGPGQDMVVFERSLSDSGPVRA
jgi:ribosomal protein S18 acetylase RimI-like enzyme